MEDQQENEHFYEGDRLTGRVVPYYRSAIYRQYVDNGFDYSLDLTAYNLIRST